MIRTSADEIRTLLDGVKRVAVLGIKTEAQSDQPAWYVPSYLAEAGLELVPVPVYYPEAVRILDRPVVRDLKQVSFASGPVDAVVIFRRGVDVPDHVDDLIALRPKLVWMQLGIRHAEATRRLIAAGIDVVQDRCLMVDHRRARASMSDGA